MKKLLFAVSAMAFALGVQAQNVTNSPYSQYGYGKLADQSNGASRGMNGLGIGLREGNQVNFLNPASYSATDSLSFIFDAGVSIQMTNFQEGQRKLNANNSSFDYFIGAFRMFKHVGMAFGAMPFSNVGYNYYSYNTLGHVSSTGTAATVNTNAYKGDGGLHQVFLGIGVEPLKVKGTSLSVGANISYLWGRYDKSIINSYSDDFVNTLSKYYQCSINDLKYDIGVQFQQQFSKKDALTIGATYSIGHNLHGTPECLIISENSQTLVSDTTTYKANGEHALPTMIGVGAMWNHAGKIRVGVDYNLEKWGSLKYPAYTVVNDQPQYVMTDGLMMDRQKFTLGGEFCANPLSRAWLSRVKYRFGVSYATPYVKINGQDGPSEISASVGLGLPITNGWNNRSMVNISAKWAQQNATGLIKENMFMISVGLNFNERWFAKWLVQ